MNRQELEEAISLLGLSGPRVTEKSIEEKIVSESYYVFPETTVTVCCLTMENGFNVIGESAAISPENFNEGLGRRIARDKAVDCLYALEGYYRKSITNNP